MLAELVFDQDSIVRVSEHTGDIIYTTRKICDRVGNVIKLVTAEEE